MPLYDYQCKKCQAVFEVRATFKEKEAGLKPECPECHSKKTQQVLTTGLLLRVVGNGAHAGGCSCDSGGGSGCCG